MTFLINLVITVHVTIADCLVSCLCLRAYITRLLHNDQLYHRIIRVSPE